MGGGWAGIGHRREKVPWRQWGTAVKSKGFRDGDLRLCWLLGHFVSSPADELRVNVKGLGADPYPL